ncbi:MAG: hypothetical protein A2340_16510 [Lentisphaerae bacterium RIFOXYB12_FULL_60_10]|nr:MAG: hypothetical protein A2340_16510 [Lentisphaerae bacterium RIFOXYB12_FULL_60_10]
MLNSRQISEGRRLPVHNASTAWHFSRALCDRRSRFGFPSVSIPTPLCFLPIHHDPHLSPVRLQHHILLTHPSHHIEWRLRPTPQRQLLQVGFQTPFHRFTYLLLDREEPVRRTHPFDPLVRPLMVVVFQPVPNPFLGILEALEPGPLQELLPDRLPEPLDLSQRHRMMRRTSNMMDTVLRQFHLEPRFAPPGRILLAVVGQHLLGQTVIPHGPTIYFQHVLRCLGSKHPQSSQIPRIVVNEPDQVDGLPIHPKGEDVALPHLVRGAPFEKPRLGRVPTDLLVRLGHHHLLAMQRLSHRLGASRQEQRPLQPLRNLAHPKARMRSFDLHHRLVNGRR